MLAKDRAARAAPVNAMTSATFVARSPSPPSADIGACADTPLMGKLAAKRTEGVFPSGRLWCRPCLHQAPPSIVSGLDATNRPDTITEAVWCAGRITKARPDRKPTKRTAQQQLRLLSRIDAQHLLRAPFPPTLSSPPKREQSAGTLWVFADQDPGSATPSGVTWYRA